MKKFFITGVGIDPIITHKWINKGKYNWSVSPSKTVEELELSITPPEVGLKSTIDWINSRIKITKVVKIATWFIIVFFLLVPGLALTQIDSARVSIFYSDHPGDGSMLFLENETPQHSEKITGPYSINITVTNIRNKNGVIRFKFYDDSAPFPHDLGFLRIVVNKTEIKNGVFTTAVHGFESGYIGIAVHDDENSNKKLDFNWFLPSEGFAFSDYYHSSFRKPLYSDFRFHLQGDKSVIMKMKYH